MQVGIKRALCAVGVCVVMVLASACSRPEMRPQRVFDAGGGQYWLVGSGGLAQRFDGQRYHDHPYPMDGDAPKWAYEPSAPIGSAHVVPFDGGALLFTKVGEVLRWSPASGRWSKLPVVLDRASPYRQLNTVVRGPDDQVVIQLHSDLIITTTARDLLAGRFAHEPTPGFLTWLGFIHGRLYGLGWDETGNTRAVYRRDAPQRWAMVARLASDQSGPVSNNLVGVAALPDGALGVFHLGGMYRVQPDPQAPVSTFERDAHVDALVRRPLGYIKRIEPIARRGAWALGGSGVIELAATPQPWSCPQGAGPWLGAVAIPGGVRLVDGEGSAWDLIDGQCTLQHRRRAKER